LKEEGLEVLSIERRELEIEEAIYMKSRMIEQSENLILNSLGLPKYRPNTTGHGRQNEIRRDGKYGSAYVGKNGALDTYMINQTADMMEKNMI
jgi:hypothetical protein